MPSLDRAQTFASPRNAFPAIEFAEPVGVFLDVDGTLLDIAERPGDVVIPDKLTGDLAELERALDGALALISGRSIAELDRIFRPLRLRASGAHGGEMRFDPGAAIAPSPDAPDLPPQLWLELQEILKDFPGTIAEDKRCCFTVHYRQARASEPRLRAALTHHIARRAPPQTEILEAHSAFEIKTKGFNKGAAVERFLARAPFRGRRPIYVGDDVTDEAAFAVARAHGGFAYSVGAERKHAMDVFADPQAVREWLAEWAQRGEAA